MYKLRTSFANYKISSWENIDGPPIEWWLLEKNNIGEEFGRPFSMKELDIFTYYVVNNKNNFPGLNNYHPANPEDAPSIEIYDMMEATGLPKALILRPVPTKYTGRSYPVMDVHLLPVHIYNLPFNVIGVFV